MSDLWDTCRERLRAQVRPIEWDQCVQFLRAWADDRVVHLWPEQGPYGTAARTPPPHLRALIDRTVRDVWARRDIRVVHDRRSPDRNRAVTERREREHRAEVRTRAQNELHQFGRECLSECVRLADDPSLVPRLTGDADQRCRQLMGIVEAGARRRLDTRRALTFGNASGSPDRSSMGSGPRQPGRLPTAQSALGEASLSAGPEDLRKAIASMPWWDDVQGRR